MKLLHVVPTYLPAVRYGGPIYSVHGLSSALAHRGHEVHVFTTNVDGPGVSDVPLSRPVERDGVHVTYFATGLGRRLYRSPEMGHFLTQRVADFDVVHLHSAFLWPTAAAAYAARRARVPYVLSPRGMLVPELIHRKSRLPKAAWIWLFERRNVAHAASIHVTADLEAVDLGRLGLKAERVDVIPNGFDLPPEAVGVAAARSAVGGPTVLCLGRVNWKKGLDRLIAAMAQVPDGRLIIAGNDEEGYQTQLREVARSCGMVDRTIFLGPVQGRAKWAALQSAEVFALASHSENFGIAVLEAMACGIPVVVTPEVGLAKVVAETGAGFVVPGTPREFGAALARLLSDPRLRAQMGEAGRVAARERFAWPAIAQQMESVYDDILAGAQQARVAEEGMAALRTPAPPRQI